MSSDVLKFKGRTFNLPKRTAYFFNPSIFIFLTLAFVFPFFWMRYLMFFGIGLVMVIDRSAYGFKEVLRKIQNRHIKTVNCGCPNRQRNMLKKGVI
jgi:hypothetical protein